MPIYEFECKNGHITETIVLSKYLSNHILCPFIEQESEAGVIRCGLPAEKIFSLPANPQTAPSTVIFRNKQTGEVRTAIARNQPNPVGFEREELKGPIERTRFEQEMQRKHNVENELVTERNFAVKAQTRKNRQADTRARLTEIADKSENPLFTRDLVKLAQERSNKKELPHKKTEFHLAINHQNSNNLDKG